jgi:hypothetical protein
MKRVSLIAALLAAFAVASPAFADDVPGASRAFSEAQKASLAGDNARAAELYELADSLSPSVQAVRSAIRSRQLAGQLASAAIHAEALLRRYPDDEKSVAMAKKLLEDVSPQLAKLSVQCTELCSLTVDGAAIALPPAASLTIYVRPGSHEIGAEFSEGRTAKADRTAREGERYDMSFSPPPKPKVDDKPAEQASVTAPQPVYLVASPQPPHRKPLGKAWVITGGVLTAGLAGGAAYFGLKTLDKRDEIKAAVAAGEPTYTLYEQGLDLQQATNILIGASAGMAVTTALLAFWTDWGGAEAHDKSVSMQPTRGGGTFVLSGSF